jgi:Fe-S oxidoreductase
VAVRLIIGLILTVGALAIAGRRGFFLYRMIRTGTPAPGRLDNIGRRAFSQITEVFGQRRLLKWTVPGAAHFLTFWGFIILGFTIVEAWGAIFDRDFFFPGIGKMNWLGFLEDLFGTLIVIALVYFAFNRAERSPARLDRKSRFYGSHNSAAWGVLGMIFLVVFTLFVYRGAQMNTGHSPWGADHRGTWWEFASMGFAKVMVHFGHDANVALETAFILANIAVITSFLVLVTYSKHLHIFLAPLNVLTKREPKALGALATTPDLESLMEEEEPVIGVGKAEHFSWKAMLDFATCTECGRCQSQCPAWNTDKPLSPKLLIMDLRDHLFAKAPYLLAGGNGSEDGKAPIGGTPGANEGDQAGAEHHHVPESGFGRVPGVGKVQDERPLVGDLESGGVIDPDVLWSCTTCGACVEQCPVDIEHVDHIIEMRRYQVLIESEFPSEAGVMLRNLENNANPWGVNPRSRTEWMQGLPFEVLVIDEGDAVPDEVEYLFWVGCAGAIEDRSKKVTRAFAELLHTAGVSFAVLGAGESCNGDPARRLGNEYLFQELAKTNIEVLNAAVKPEGKPAKTIVATCPHCFNTLGREYGALGGEYTVLHHTQLLGQLVAEGRLTPVTPVDGLITYHDPCYLGRHNEVYAPPREVLASVPGLSSQEMHRCRERGFCCGAGGARMWMEERIGKQINVERIDEALGLDPDMVGTACPFCMVMLSDAVTAKKQSGEARDEVEVLDVAQLLLRSVSGPPKQPALVGGSAPANDDSVGGAGPERATPEATARADNPQLSPEASPDDGS